LTGRHHALYLYRIVAMTTEAEDNAAMKLARRFEGHRVVREGLRIVDELLAPRNGLGRMRLREHPLCPRDADPDWLLVELRRLLTAQPTLAATDPGMPHPEV
jgi:hypothetical protein